ncbi:MAG: hypothetical protein A2Z20_09600 [Bdellovibrionales bacterium RBG_16_40_8]|nr:MAG: hypothetical protein A2Z20_09600 [Bdellovibrionales bacterium RBG_16_40_8]
MFLFLVLFISFEALGAETVGSFFIQSIHLRPTFLSQEDTGADFSLADSTFAIGWKKNKNLSVFFEVGSEKLRNLPAYYAASEQNRLGFYKAFIEFQGVYGRFRFGLIPLNFGYDGILENYERIFNKSLLYSQRIIGISDYGMSFFSELNGYYTQLTIHNGEIDTTSDGRLWVSGNWGYTDGRNFRTQLSLQTGYVRGDVSTGATNTLAGVVNGEIALWRNGVIFANWYQRNWNVVMQFGGGEVKQDDDTGRYSTEMYELTNTFTKNLGVGVRYDKLNPNRKASGDGVTEVSLMFLLKSIDSTSNFVILGTKAIEESSERHNDQLRIEWVLTPFAR